MRMKVSYGDSLEHSFELDVPKNTNYVKLTVVKPEEVSFGNGYPDWAYSIVPR